MTRFSVQSYVPFQQLPLPTSHTLHTAYTWPNDLYKSPCTSTWPFLFPRCFATLLNYIIIISTVDCGMVVGRLNWRWVVACCGHVFVVVCMHISFVECELTNGGAEGWGIIASGWEVDGGGVYEEIVPGYIIQAQWQPLITLYISSLMILLLLFLVSMPSLVSTTSQPTSNPANTTDAESTENPWRPWWAGSRQTPLNHKKEPRRHEAKEKVEDGTPDHDSESGK